MYGIFNIRSNGNRVCLYHNEPGRWLLSRTNSLRFDPVTGRMLSVWTEPVPVSPTVGLSWYRRHRRQQQTGVI